MTIPSLTRSGSQLYSLAGSLFLLISGQYFFFFFPEWFIYGGIGMGVAVLAVLNILALSNVSVCLSNRSNLGADMNGDSPSITFSGPMSGSAFANSFGPLS